jgi:hypothetical protein
MNAGKLAAIVAAVLLGGLGIACGSGDGGGSEPPFSPETQTSTAALASPASPVKLTAKATTFKPSVIYSGGDFTSVQVTVTNNSKENIPVNPLDFTITAADGAKHNTALGEDERQIDTLTLAAGEHVTGVISAEGKFKPARVTFNVSTGGAVVASVK